MYTIAPECDLREISQAFDLMRTARFFLMGSCVSAPCVRTLYLVMERCVKSKGSFAMRCFIHMISYSCSKCDFHDHNAYF